MIISISSLLKHFRFNSIPLVYKNFITIIQWFANDTTVLSRFYPTNALSNRDSRPHQPYRDSHFPRISFSFSLIWRKHRDKVELWPRGHGEWTIVGQLLVKTFATCSVNCVPRRCQLIEWNEAARGHVHAQPRENELAAN